MFFHAHLAPKFDFAQGKSWKALLKKSDSELGIDPEFTRPGVAAFLKKFEDKVGEMH